MRDQTMSTMPSHNELLVEKTQGNVFTWTQTTLVFLWLLIMAREETSLSVNNYSEILPIISGISIVHAVSLAEKDGGAYNIPFWELVKPLYGSTHSALAAKTSGLIITNSRYNKELIQKRYNAENSHRKPVHKRPAILW